MDGPPVSCRLTVDSTAAALQPLALPAASLTDQTLAAIRQATRSGALQPEQLYSAYQIAAMPGVSQSPVREALASDYHDGWTYQGGAFSLFFSVSWLMISLGLARLCASAARNPKAAER